MAVCRVYLAVESSSAKDGVHGDKYAVAGIEWVKIILTIKNIMGEQTDSLSSSMSASSRRKTSIRTHKSFV